MGVIFYLRFSQVIKGYDDDDLKIAAHLVKEEQKHRRKLTPASVKQRIRRARAKIDSQTQTRTSSSSAQTVTFE